MKNCITLSAALLACLLSAQPEESTTKVKSLLAQLQDPTDAKRSAAEWELLKLGPDILPLLPSASKSPDRLPLIRDTLTELQPRTWETKAVDMPLVDALAGLKKNTGLTLADRRQGGVSKQMVKLAAGKMTYWQIVETLAAQTDSRLSLYQTDGQIALVDGPNPQLPVRLHGPFRLAVKRVSAKLDFEGKTHTGVLGLEIAWEPRFLPYLIEVGDVSYIIHAIRKVDSPILDIVRGRGPVVVTENNAKEFDVEFASPSRMVAALQSVKGHFVVTMPSKSLVFAFKLPKQGEMQTRDGVQLTVTKIAADKDRWTVELAIDVPAAGPSFASFQTWLGSKAWLDHSGCHFERVIDGTKVTLRPNPLYTQIIGIPTSTHVTARYQFTPGKNAGIPQDWRLVCRVPGRMVEMTVPFSFDKIELP